MFRNFVKYILEWIRSIQKMTLPNKPKTYEGLMKFINGPYTYKDIPNSKYAYVKITDNWEKENLVEIALPCLDLKSNVIQTIKCHKKLKLNIEKLFSEYVKNEYHKDYPIVQIYCFSPRHKMQNIKRSLSNHAYGIAIDINWFHNQVGTTGNIPEKVVNLFKKYNWTWGGDWKSFKDPMHFEYYG